MFAFLLIKQLNCILFQRVFRNVSELSDIKDLLKKGNIEFYKNIYLIYLDINSIDYIIGVDDLADMDLAHSFLSKLNQELEGIWKPLNSTVFLLEIDRIARVVDDAVYSYL